MPSSPADNPQLQARRGFLKAAAATAASTTALGTSVGAFASDGPASDDVILTPTKMLGSLREISRAVVLEDGVWREAESANDGFVCEFEPGALADKRFLTADILLGGDTTVSFVMQLQEGPKGPAFWLRFFLLPACSARIRMPIERVDLAEWGIAREGAWLKPRFYGKRVDLSKVDRVLFKVFAKAEENAAFCLTPIRATKDDVPTLETLVLPRGKLLDEVGQSAIRSWEGKTSGVEEMKARLLAQARTADEQRWPEAFTDWGGCDQNRLTDGEGFFRTYNDGERWWLVDPTGHAFWSAGMDCVRPDTTAYVGGLADALTWAPPWGEFQDARSTRAGEPYISYLIANFIRAFGPEKWYDQWGRLALAQLRRTGFNTVANWSDWKIARAARFPYVRPMNFNPKRVAKVFRDLPDVYDPRFEQDAADYASQLAETADDPALIGYFMMNEPKWGFAWEPAAAGMLYADGTNHTRQELAKWLRARYGDDPGLSAAWGSDVTLAQVERGKLKQTLQGKAIDDLSEFSAIVVERYFETLTAACRRVDANHLNLGIRYAGVPPMWVTGGMKSFDVFSMNNYRERIPADQVKKIHDTLHMPVMIGEFHFGALDAGLPSSGLGRVATQVDRGKAYRVYIEDAAANPYCVGAHWFTLYDQSAMGRFDGENYNIGFLDVCNRPYDALCDAALATHRRIYEIASGDVAPYDDAPEYFKRLC